MDGIIATAGRTQPPRAVNGAGADESPEHLKLREVCREFEGLMLGHVLKQGILSETGDEEDAVPGKDVFMEFAMEQTARELGRREAMGLATALYRQLTQELGGHGRIDSTGD